jgi:hypothetical protein
MNPAFLLGNGKSRETLNVCFFKKYGMVYGCNAIYREHFVDVLFAGDTPMIIEILNKKYKGEFIYRVPDQHLFRSVEGKLYSDYGYATGPTALKILCYRLANTITDVFLIGFDLYGLPDGKVNNIYAGTENYASRSSQAIPHSNWTNQLWNIFCEYDNITFHRVGNTKDTMPEKWKKLQNIKFISVEDMGDMLTNCLIIREEYKDEGFTKPW